MGGDAGGGRSSAASLNGASAHRDGTKVPAATRHDGRTFPVRDRTCSGQIASHPLGGGRGARRVPGPRSVSRHAATDRRRCLVAPPRGRCRAPGPWRATGRHVDARGAGAAVDQPGLAQQHAHGRGRPSGSDVGPDPSVARLRAGHGSSLCIARCRSSAPRGNRLAGHDRLAHLRPGGGGSGDRGPGTDPRPAAGCRRRLRLMELPRRPACALAREPAAAGSRMGQPARGLSASLPARCRRDRW